MKHDCSIVYNDTQIYLGFLFNIYNKNNMKMKDNKHIQIFNEHQENLNISDVSGRYSLEEAKKFAMEKFNSDKMKSKYPKGGWVKIDDILSVLEVGVECGYKFGQKSNDH